LLLGYVLIEVYYTLAADGGCELLMRRFNALVLLLPLLLLLCSCGDRSV
jgi:hypothetical protein